MKKVSLFIALLFLFFTVNASASEYDSYAYTSSKTKLTYELITVNLTTTNLYLEGWAYIPDSQHYKYANDVKTTIMAYQSGGQKFYFPTTITSKYNLTSIEKYEGVPYCSQTDYNNPASTCSYYYNYVTFNVNIPLSTFTYPNSYEFYIYVKAMDSGVARYTKLYSPNVEDVVTSGNYTYNFESDISEAQLVVNTPSVFVRTSPAKGDNNHFVYNSCTYYWKNGSTFTMAGKAFNSPVTWYYMNFYPSGTSGYGGCLATPGSTKKGYIAGNYVNFTGYGNSKLTITTNSDFNTSSVMVPTINNQDVKVGTKIKATGLNVATNATVELTYGTYKQSFTNTYNNNETKTLYFTIPKDKIVKNQNVTVNVKVSDKNNTNNQVTITPYYATNSTNNVTLSSNQNKITLTAKSGLEYTNKVLTPYNETITINLEAPIEKIQDSLNQYDNFEHFYAGGSFNYDLNVDYKNDYPYSYNYVNDEKAKLIIDSSYIDNPSGEINYVKNNNNYSLTPVYITKDNIISNSSVDALYPEGKDVIYTSFELSKGTYPFTVTLNSSGVNKMSTNINTYFKTNGILFSQSPDTLLYYRSASPKNPFPNGTSVLWDQNNITSIYDEEVMQKVKIDVTKEGKKIIKDWVEQDYANNIRNNDQEFKTLIQSLQNSNDLVIGKE